MLEKVASFVVLIKNSYNRSLTSTERYRIVVVKKKADTLERSRAREPGNLAPNRMSIPTAFPVDKVKV